MKLNLPKVKVNKKFDWKKTAKKAALAALVTAIAGFMAYAENEPAFLALVPLLAALQNILKHKIKW